MVMVMKALVIGHLKVEGCKSGRAGVVPLLPFHCQSAGLDGKMKALVIHTFWLNLRRGRGIKWVGVVAPPSLLLSECLCGHFGNRTEGTASEMNLRRGGGYKVGGCGGPSFPSTVGVGNGTEGTASEMNLRRGGRGIKWVGVVAPPSLLLSELVMELKALHLKGEGNEFEKGEGYEVGGCGGPSFHSTVRVLMWTFR